MAIDPQDIMLTNEQRRLVAEIADRTGRAWADVLAEAIQSYHPHAAAGSTPNGVSYYDAMKDVIGIVQGAPADLSTNPKYMADFGRDRDAGAE